MIDDEGTPSSIIKFNEIAIAYEEAILTRKVNDMRSNIGQVEKELSFYQIMSDLIRRNDEEMLELQSQNEQQEEFTMQSLQH